MGIDCAVLQMTVVYAVACASTWVQPQGAERSRHRAVELALCKNCEVQRAITISASLASRSAFKRSVFSRVARASASYSVTAARPSCARCSFLKRLSAFCENQPRDAGGDDRHDAISRELFHEQISGIGSN